MPYEALTAPKAGSQLNSGKECDVACTIKVYVPAPHSDPARDGETLAQHAAQVPGSPDSSVLMMTRQAAKHDRPKSRLVRSCFSMALNSKVLSWARWAKWLWMACRISSFGSSAGHCSRWTLSFKRAPGGNSRAQPTMNSSALSSRSFSMNGEGSIELKS